MKKLIYNIGICLSLAACSNRQPENAPVPDKVSEKEESSIKLEPGMLVSEKDTVCGMTIGNEPGDTLTYQGKLLGFCGSGCKEAFLAEHTSK